MPKRILSVGQCQPDNAALRQFVSQHFDCEFLLADGLEETLRQLSQSPCDLVLVNRKLDCDYSDGIEIIRHLKADPELAATPVMLVTNYADHQAQAVAAGAAPGFGKLQFDQPETLQRLRAALSEA